MSFRPAARSKVGQASASRRERERRRRLENLRNPRQRSTFPVGADQQIVAQLGPCSQNVSVQLLDAGFLAGQTLRFVVDGFPTKKRTVMQLPSA
jgi:hypothetical protein